ncbi:MAG: radical SAM protein [Candidatus Omnitrophota bacterium]
MKRPKKILLLSSNYKKGYMRNARCDFVSWSGTQWYPIQLGYLGAYLESQGYVVLLVDAQAYNLTDEKVGAIFKNFKPDYAVVYAGNESFDFDKALTEKITKEICPAILAGPFYAYKTAGKRIWGISGCLENGVQQWIEQGADPNTHVFGTYLPTHKLDKIPFVSEFFAKRLHPKYYRTPSEPWPFVSIMTGRGCYWGKCTFCLWPRVAGSQGYYCRSIPNVIDELRFIEKIRIYKSVMIEDDSFPERRIIDFCEAKIKAGIRIPWSCYVRAELRYETMVLMKQAKCLNIHVGYESGSDSTLERIKKGITVDEMAAFTRRTKRAGLHIHGDFLIGIDRAEDEIDKTIRFACKIRPTTAQFQVYIPYFEEEIWYRPWLERKARIAYQHFYSDPRAWPAVMRQLWKPAVLRQSIKTILGVKG